MIYSFLGFILERIINVIFLGYYYDNSVLVGPYQPLYGIGIILAIIIYDLFLDKINPKFLRYVLLFLVAIITTGFSELINGEGYEFFTNSNLWDYGDTFTCNYEYVCLLPTSMFGVLSGLAILLIHPFIKLIVSNAPRFFMKWTYRILLFIFIIDVSYTFFFVLL
jgi:uncharacterized membrane protein